jgi:ankyrin repeat protein
MVDTLGNTALHWAAKWGSVTQIQLIVNRPTCVDVVNKVGETALHVAAREGKRPTVITLCELNANVNATDFMARTPAHLAAGTGKYFVLKELVSRGANFNARDIYHRTVLQWAARSDGSSRALRYLVKKKYKHRRCGWRRQHSNYVRGLRRSIREYQDSNCPTS